MALKLSYEISIKSSRSGIISSTFMRLVDIRELAEQARSADQQPYFED
jgi:hypothetical protein